MEVTAGVCSALVDSGLENCVQFGALQLGEFPEELDILQDSALHEKVFEQLSLSPEERWENFPAELETFQFYLAWKRDDGRGWDKPFWQGGISRQ